MSHSNSESCTIHNVSLDRHFKTMPTQIFENSNLSWAAKGLLGYILSRPSDWKIHTWQLVKIYQGGKSGNGRDAVKVLIKELRDAGYINYIKSKDSEGKWVHRYDVYPLPLRDFQKMFPETEFPATDFPATENPSVIINNELPNIELNTPKGDIAQTASRPSYEINFSFEKSKFEGIEKRDLDSWKELYPTVDIIQELKRMREWVISNTQKSKSKKKWRTFINNWLRKCNETNINKDAYLGAKALPKEKDTLGKKKTKFKPNGEMYEE